MGAEDVICVVGTDVVDDRKGTDFVRVVDVVGEDVVNFAEDAVWPEEVVVRTDVTDFVWDLFSDVSREVKLVGAEEVICVEGTKIVVECKGIEVVRWSVVVGEEVVESSEDVRPGVVVVIGDVIEVVGDVVSGVLREVKVVGIEIIFVVGTTTVVESRGTDVLRGLGVVWEEVVEGAENVLPGIVVSNEVVDVVWDFTSGVMGAVILVSADEVSCVFGTEVADERRGTDVDVEENVVSAKDVWPGEVVVRVDAMDVAGDVILDIMREVILVGAGEGIFVVRTDVLEVSPGVDVVRETDVFE